MRSLEAPDSEVVEDACHFLGGLLNKVNDRVDSLLVLADVVSRPCLEVVNVLILGEFKDEIGLFPVDLAKDFLERVLLLVCVVSVQLVHVEGKVRQHLVVEFVEVFVLFWILAFDFT